MNFRTSVWLVLLVWLSVTGVEAQGTTANAASSANLSGTKSSTTSTAIPASGDSDWTKTWSVLVTVNTSFNSNLEHDPVPLRAAGIGPSIVAGYQVRSKRHRARFIYGLGGSRYTRSTDLNRIGNYFGASYRFTLGRWSAETEGEVILKGTNDDRETNDQYIATQKIGYRFDSKTRANIYYAYRLKRYIPADADRNSVNPMYGFKFSRQFGQKADWDIGYRYDENRAQNPRQNYVRSTYDTSLKYQLTKNDLLKTGFSYKPRLYSRTLNVGDLRLPRRDRKYAVDFNWRHNLSDRLGFDLGYAYEKQTSNDLEKLYNDHQINFSIFYHWGNGDTLEP